MRTLGCAAALLALGCTTTRMDFHTLPPPERFASIEPGVTTRSEVLRRLGPPDELRRPANFERARRTTPQLRRVLEAGDVFGTDAWTWASGRRSTRSLSLPPGPSLFSVAETRSREERWRIEFDGVGVVRSVSHVDEIGDEW